MHSYSWLSQQWDSKRTISQRKKIHIQVLKPLNCLPWDNLLTTVQDPKVSRKWQSTNLKKPATDLREVKSRISKIRHQKKRKLWGQWPRDQWENLMARTGVSQVNRAAVQMEDTSSASGKEQVQHCLSWSLPHYLSSPGIQLRYQKN